MEFYKLKYAIENNAYDGINVSKLINDNPKILNKLYHDNNLLHIIIINYNQVTIIFLIIYYLNYIFIKN